MTTITQVISPLSTPPSSADPANFESRADTFLADVADMAVELETARGQINTVIGEVNTNAATATTQAGIATAQAGNAATDAGTATTQAGIATTKAGDATTQAGIATAQAALALAYAAALSGSSATSVAIGTGAKSFTASTGKQWAAGQFLMLASAANNTNYMHGQVTSYNSGTGALVMNVIDTDGSGTWADWLISVSGTQGVAGIPPNRTYFQTLAACLEPAALVPQFGAFSHAIAGGAVEYLMASYATALGGAGRLENRNPVQPIALSGVTISGLSSGAEALLIDPTLPVYANAESTYYARKAALDALATKHVALTAARSKYSLLPGPYGSIITGVTSMNFTWVTAMIADAIGFNLMEERGDTGATDWLRQGHGLCLPINKGVVAQVQSGDSGGTGSPLGGITFVHLPSTWGAIADPNTYTFRDDFMGASLDTAATWTRAQSTAGNVEIDAVFPWLKMTGNGSWAANGLHSQASIARAAGKVFMCDVHIPPGVVAAAAPNLLVGWSDGAGQDYANFIHAVDFTAGGGITLDLQVHEAGAFRSIVGNHYSAGSTYRIRITLGANNAAYAIQGLPEYNPIGSASWTDITPGVTSSSVTPLHPGATINSAVSVFVGDVRTF
jgi:hypothetical protein